jgi:hypothetical protein
MPARPLLLGLALAVTVAGCQRLDPTASPEAVVEAAYAAIKAGDWEAYSDLTVTSADFILKEQGMQSKLKGQGSFAGAVLKPEEQQAQREQFERALAGGEGLIDFKLREFGRAHLAARGFEETLSGSEIPISAYLVSVAGETRPTQDGPSFVVAQWGSFYKVLRLTFPGDYEAEMAAGAAAPALN